MWRNDRRIFVRIAFAVTFVYKDATSGELLQRGEITSRGKSFSCSRVVNSSCEVDLWRRSLIEAEETVLAFV